MKISILQENLIKGLLIASRLVATKAALPVLENILIETEKGQLKLSATNLEAGVNLWLGAKIEKEGSLTVPAKILTEFINFLSPGKIDLETDKYSLLVSSGSFKANLMGADSNDFPKTPSTSNEVVLVFDKKDLINALNQVVFAASQDEGRPVLTGVLIKKGEGEKISLVATDGYRLSLKEVLPKEVKIKEGFLIPAKALLEVSRLAKELESEEPEIKMVSASEKNQVVFIFPKIEFYSRLIEGEFPDYKKIIPGGFSTKVELDKEEFLKAVKIASIFAREQANIVKLKIESGKLTISSETPQVGGNESEISTKTEGEDLEIALNCRFLLDFLNTCPGEEVVFEASGPLSPTVFKIKGDDSFLHVIMPVRIQA